MLDRVRRYEFGVFVVPVPDPLRSAIAALRQPFDGESASIAPPHITLTEPLADQPNDIARADLGAALAGVVGPFEITVGPADVFAGTEIVYLTVKPVQPLLALRTRAHSSGLFRLDGPHAADYVPHVTIREAVTRSDTTAAVIAAVDAAAVQGRFRCDVVELWRPGLDGAFRAVARERLVGS